MTSRRPMNPYPLHQRSLPASPRLQMLMTKKKKLKPPRQRQRLRPPLSTPAQPSLRHKSLLRTCPRRLNSRTRRRLLSQAHQLHQPTTPLPPAWWTQNPHLQQLLIRARLRRLLPMSQLLLQKPRLLKLKVVMSLLRQRCQRRLAKPNLLRWTRRRTRRPRKLQPTSESLWKRGVELRWFFIKI